MTLSGLQHDAAFFTPEQRYKCLADQLDLLHASLRQADSKAIGLTAAASVVVNAVVTITFRVSTQPGHTVRLFLSLALLLALATAVLGVMALIPRLRNPAGGNSAIFFAEVAEHSSRERSGHITRLMSLTPGQWSDEVANQLWSNSQIARRKFRFVQWAAVCLLASLICIAAAIGRQLLS